MNFKNMEDMERFLKDEPYYISKDNFCLGNTHEEAAEIIRLMCKETKGIKKVKGEVLCGNG